MKKLKREFEKRQRAEMHKVVPRSLDHTKCEHIRDVSLYQTGYFTVSLCEDCGLMDVRSGEDDFNNKENGNAWGNGLGDSLLTQHIARAKEFDGWLITKEQFDALPDDVKAMLTAGVLVH